jgi:hypothetical protein
MGEDPAVGMAGFGSPSGEEPGVEMAGFDSSDPTIALLTGFPSACKYLRTVSRSIPSSRAMALCDQLLLFNATIAVFKSTLSSFIKEGCGSRRSFRKVSLKLAGFDSTLSGWF